MKKKLKAKRILLPKDRRLVRVQPRRVIDDEGNLFNALVPMNNIIPKAAMNNDNDDFEEVSIDGSSSSLSGASSSNDPSTTLKASAVFMCKSCKIYFPLPKMLDQHIKTIHSERRPVYGPQSILDKLREKVGGYTRNKQGVYACNNCSFSSPWKTYIASHVSRKHGKLRNSIRNLPITKTIANKLTESTEDPLYSYKNDITIHKIDSSSKKKNTTSMQTIISDTQTKANAQGLKSPKKKITPEESNHVLADSDFAPLETKSKLKISHFVPVETESMLKVSDYVPTETEIATEVTEEFSPQETEEFDPHNTEEFVAQKKEKLISQDKEEFIPQDGVEFTVQNTEEFVPQDAVEFTVQNTEKCVPQKMGFIPQDTEEFVPHKTEFIPQNTEEFVPEGAEEFTVQDTEEFAPQNTELVPQDTEEFIPEIAEFEPEEIKLESADLEFITNETKYQSVEIEFEAADIEYMSENLKFGSSDTDYTHAQTKFEIAKEMTSSKTKFDSNGDIVFAAVDTVFGSADAEFLTSDMCENVGETNFVSENLETIPMEIEISSEETKMESEPIAKENIINQKILPKKYKYKCPYCDFQSKKRTTMHSHMINNHDEETSNLTFPENNEEITPVVEKYVPVERNFPCEYCNYAATTKNNLLSHMRCKHPEFAKPRVKRRRRNEELQCEQCEFKTIDRRKLLVHIERKHVIEYRYTCEYCGKKFKVKCDLTSHIRFQHFKTPIVCDVCGKICSNSNSLHVHQKREHYKPDFECHICKRRMVSKENLNDHILKQHELRSDFICEQCGKVFDQQNKLKLHALTHTGERPHKCHVCGKSFARRAVFRQHLLIHTGQRPYVCDICGKSFTQKPGLICHRKGHPGEKPPLPVVYIDDILSKYVKKNDNNL